MATAMTNVESACDSLEDAPCLGCSDALTIPGADEHMTEEELSILVELNRENPAGAIEAELDHFPAFTGWPEWASSFYWSEPETRLTLPELIDLEAKRLRDRGNAAGDLMAVAIEELARVVRTVGAMTPADVDARLEVLERDYSDPMDCEPELTAAGRWA